MASSGGDRSALAALGAFRAIRRFLPERRPFVVIGVTALLTSLCEAGSLVLITLSATQLAAADRIGSVFGLDLSIGAMLGSAAALLVLRFGLGFLNSRTSAHLAARGLTNARRTVLDAFVRSDWERQAAQSAGALIDLLAARADLCGALVTIASTMVVAAANLTMLGLVSLALQPVAVLALAVIGAVFYAIIRPVNRWTRRSSKDLMVSVEGFLEGVNDLAHNHRELAVYGTGQEFLAALDEHQVVASAAYARTRTLTGFLPQVYQSFGLGLAVLGLAVATIFDVSDVGLLGAVVLLLLRGVSYGQQLTSASQSINERIPYVQSVIDLLDDLDDNVAGGGAQRPERIGALTLAGVTYDYGNRARALSGVDLAVAPGEMLGIVGPSGGGKTTLIQVLAGLRQPTEGTVRVDGVDRREVDRAWWSQRVALVPQDVSLLTGTVALNIDVYRGLPPEALVEAASRAQMDDDIVNIGGLDTPLSRYGSAVSGGQLQRLGIARALAGRPELLLLDEPTSALDVATETRLSRVLEDLRGQVTMVIVAHRLSTVATCDRVVVVEEGRIVADGPPDEVLEAFGRRAIDAWDVVEGP